MGFHPKSVPQRTHNPHLPKAKGCVGYFISLSTAVGLSHWRDWVEPPPRVFGKAVALTLHRRHTSTGEAKKCYSEDRLAANRRCFRTSYTA